MSTPSALHGPFSEPGQQQEAARLGLWLFIANELMLFGGLFMALTVYRIIHTETTRAASEHLHLWIGGANTAVLLTSSLTMVLAVATIWSRLAIAAMRAATLTASPKTSLSSTRASP